MCGITGIFSFKPSDTDFAPHLGRMTKAVAHRGPDAEGTFCDRQKGIYFGHKRLSIIDLSTRASQPMWDYQKRYALVYNGEIYNYRELKSQIDDYPFSTSSDSEVILASYRKWGPDCVTKFNGIFALAIWDDLEETLFVVRDHIGVKPLYYFMNDDMFVFSSELRSLLDSGLIRRELDRKALSDYFMYQSTMRGTTLVRNVVKLDPGMYLLLGKNSKKSVRYWDITRQHEFGFKSESEIHSEVRQRLMTAVRRQMVSDVPVGAFLSGGIDSGILVAAMSLQSKQPINTYTLTFKEKSFDESYYAKLLAKQYHTHHHEVHVSAEEILSHIPEILDNMDNPSGDGINSYLVSKAIKDAGLKVAITGLGGDELFAGYGFARTYKKILSQNGLWSKTQSLRSVVSRFLADSRNVKFKKASELLRIRKPALYNVYPVLRSIYFPDTASALAHDESGNIHELEKEMKELESRLSAFPFLSQFGIGDMLGYTEGVLLKDCDQMSMANSIELRVPYFDVDLVEYVLAIPDQFKDPVQPKRLLINSTKGLIPEEIWNKKKMGFTLPWDIWLRGELKGFCGDAIDSMKRRELLDNGILTDHWQNYLKGKHAISWVHIWMVVALEHWLQNVIDPGNG